VLVESGSIPKAIEFVLNPPADVVILLLAMLFGSQRLGGKMSTTAVENLIISSIHGAFIKYPEGDGGPNLDYEWIAPDQSAHIAKAILLDLAANGYAIVKQSP
jgi:hypothetical protein